MAEAMSKSAKKRAAKQARDAAHAAETVPEEPAPAPNDEPKEQPKAAKAAPAPKAAEQQPKAKGDQKKQPAKKKEVEAAPLPVVKKDGDPKYAVEVDDGSGGNWETAAGVSKKNQRRKEKKDEEEKAKKDAEIEKAKAAKEAAKAGLPAPADSGPKSTSGMNATEAAIARARELANAPSSVPIVAAAAPEKAEEDKTNLVTASITVPEEKIGRIIGPQGKNLKLIEEKTGVKRIDTDSGVFTVVGENADSVAQAELAIKEMVEKGYMSLAFDDFQQIEVMVHPSAYPDIIGKGGCVIQKIKKELEVEISIPQVPKNANTGNKKYGISVAGSKVNTDKAKECIESIVNYYHHEITHEGLDHIEMDVPAEAYSYIIGRQGSEMRHIQKNWDVKVYIPRETSANQSVVIVGLKRDCDRARQYIEKQVSSASEQKTDKRQDKPDDHWGDEEPEEPWMKDYMINRKK